MRTCMVRGRGFLGPIAVQTRPLLPHTTTEDLRCLAEIDRSLGIYNAYAHLSDRSFACLSRSYQKLADAVFRVVTERARHSA